MRSIVPFHFLGLVTGGSKTVHDFHSGTAAAAYGGITTVISFSTQPKGGSLLRADGGYLILSARDVLSEPGVWPVLKMIRLASENAVRSRRPSSTPRQT